MNIQYVVGLVYCRYNTKNKRICRISY